MTHRPAQERNGGKGMVSNHAKISNKKISWSPWQLVSLTHFACVCVEIFHSWVPKPEFIVLRIIVQLRSLRIHIWHMTSIKTSSTTPGQRSPDMGGFFQLLYNGSFGAGHQICIRHKDWEWTGGDWIIFKQKKSLESISNSQRHHFINVHARLQQQLKENLFVHICTKNLLLQLFIAVWVSGQALTSDFWCPKNQVSHGIPKGIPAFTKVWPNKPAAHWRANTEHTEKPVALRMFVFFLAHLFFLQQISNRFWKQTVQKFFLLTTLPPLLEIDAFFNPAWVLRVVGHPPISKVVEAAILAMVPLAQDVHH